VIKLYYFRKPLLFNKKNIHMKKIIIITAIVFISINLNAQWFIAGSVGLNVYENKETLFWDEGVLEKATTTYSSIGFSVSPKVGYYFNEKLAAGLCLYVGAGFNNTTVNHSNIHTYNTKRQAIHWSVCPYVRYSVFSYKKFSIILEGRTGVGGSHSFYKPDGEKTGWREGKNYSNTLAVGVLNVTPILGFKLTDRIQVEAGLHFLNLGYNIDMIKEEYIDACCGNPNRKNTTKHDINIGFNSSSILVASRLQFGIIYKF